MSSLNWVGFWVIRWRNRLLNPQQPCCVLKQTSSKVRSLITMYALRRSETRNNILDQMIYSNSGRSGCAWIRLQPFGKSISSSEDVRIGTFRHFQWANEINSQFLEWVTFQHTFQSVFLILSFPQLFLAWQTTFNDVRNFIP